MRQFALKLLGAGVAGRLARAYIDPNTGGLLFQALAVIFGLLSGLVLFFSARIRMAFARLRRALRGKRAAADTETTAVEEVEA